MRYFVILSKLAVFDDIDFKRDIFEVKGDMMLSRIKETTMP